MQIHPTAIVAQSARLGEGVEVGPYSVIGPQAVIGDHTTVASHVVIDGQTRIGSRCRIFTGACLGTPAQIYKSSPIQSVLEIGDENIIREYVTMNPSMKEGGATRVGHRNLFMIGVHIAHDCVLGNDITVANSAGLAGHVVVEDHAVIGGIVGIHQFVRIGRLSMVGGVSKVVMDVAPFSICDGHPAVFHGPNAVGLRRAGYSPSDCAAIKKALKILFLSGDSLKNAVRKVEQLPIGRLKEIRHLLDFVSGSKRGISRGDEEQRDVVE